MYTTTKQQCIFMFYYFAMQQINTSSLSGVVRSVKSVNTTIGRMSYTTSVICQPLSMSVVKTVLEDSGLENVEVIFVNLEGKTQGMF